MTARHGLYVANGSAGVTSPLEARLALAGLFSGPGVVNGAVVSGSSSGPNMKYNVAAGTFLTQRGTLAVDGLYLWVNDATVLIDSGAPAPSSGTRWDLIYVTHHNANDGFGDANSDPVIGVLVGVAGSTPSKPYTAGSGAGGASLPTNALVIAESQVGTNIANAAAATITQVAPVPASRVRSSFCQMGRSTTLAGGVPSTTTTAASSFSDGILGQAGDVVYSGGGLITVGHDGPYRWSASSLWSATGAGASVHTKQCFVWVNGSETTHAEGKTSYPCPAGATGSMSQVAGGVLMLHAGDTLQLAYYQNSSIGLQVQPMTFTVEAL